MFALEERLGRTIQVLYFDVDSAADRASLRKTSTGAMIAGPRIFVFGDESQLEQLLSKDKELMDGEQSQPRQSDEGIKI